MAFKSWRGDVGLIKPTMRPGSLEDLIRLLPEGIGVVPILQDVRRGTSDEFTAALAGYERIAARLAKLELDLIHHAGTPPFMMQGFAGEKRLIESWQRKYGVPMITDGRNVVQAFRALGARRLVGISYSRLQNEITSKYLTEAGFDVLAMEPMEVPFEKAGDLSAQQIYAHARRTFLDNPGAGAIYLQGGAWHVLGILQMLEDDLGVPVVEAGAALCWQIQKRLHVNQPRTGFGRLLAELPELPAQK
jgi:maleate cis-trans isomerase